MEEINKESGSSDSQEKSFFQVIVHSFFIIPFLIIVFGLILFTAINLLTREQRSVYDYLEDVKTGGLSKRWQGAFELSRILANPKLIPDDGRFINELTTAFEESTHDDARVRQYLALAMGRTEKKEFVRSIITGLKSEKEENIPSLIYALGMLKSSEATPIILSYTDHQNARIRSIAVAALGNIKDISAAAVLKKSLHDPEVNVGWGAAASLAELGDSSGKEILAQMMNRAYLSTFPEVDQDEQNNIMLMAINAASKINHSNLNQKIEELAQSDQNMKIRTAAMKALNK